MDFRFTKWRMLRLLFAACGLFVALPGLLAAYPSTAVYPPIIRPSLASKPVFVYPPEAIRQRHQGMATVLLVVDVHGMPRNIRIQRSSGFSELDKAALEAVQHWTFKPELKYGVPTEAEVAIPVSFNLNMLGDDLPIAVSALSNELFRLWLPNGDAFTASLENGNLALEHYPPFKPQPGQHAFPTPPSNASSYAQTLETAYHDGYVAAIHHGEPPASRCLINCLRTLRMAFYDGSTVFLNVQDDSSEAILLALDGLPTADDARAAGTMTAYLHLHPGLELNNWELRDKAGATVKSALLYYYDLPKSAAAALSRMSIAPPPPSPPVAPSSGEGVEPTVDVCRRTMVREAEHTLADSEAQIPVVTVVVNRSGQVAREWIARSSNSKFVDVSALNDAAHWTFNGIACEGQRVTESVGIARQ
jgi:TonB family protein